jgi:hypothetical protein
MWARVIVSMTGIMTALPVTAGELKADAALRFVAGKLFAYHCFDGTAGVGRISADGSVAGTIQMQGNGAVRYAVLPAGTLRIKDGAVCASLKGVLWEPCFNLVQTDPKSFRGSIRGLDFAYCTFTAHNPGTKTAPARSGPLPLGAFKGSGRSR